MKSKFLLLVLSFCSATVELLASMEHLQENSPFIPADYKPRGGPTRPTAQQPKPPAARKIELSGVIQLGGKYSFSFYEPAKKQSYWVEMNDPKAPIKVVDFNPVAQSVTIESEAGTEVITIRKPAAPSGTPQKSTPPPNVKPPQPPQRKAPPPPPMSDEEALKLLEKILLGSFDDDDLGPLDDSMTS